MACNSKPQAERHSQREPMVSWNQREVLIAQCILIIRDVMLGAEEITQQLSELAVLPEVPS